MPTQVTEEPLFNTFSGEYEWHSRSWVRTPNWPRVPKRDLPINTYVDVQDSVEQTFWGGQRSIRTSDGAITWYDNPKFRWNGNMIRDEFYSAYALADWQNFAQGVMYETELQALGRIADQKVNLPVLTAEAGKTATHITNTAVRVVQAYKSFVRGHFKEVAKELGISSGTRHKSWLEYKYGWMPLLMDIKGSAESFAEHQLGGRPPVFLVQATSHKDLKWSYGTQYTPFGGGSQLYTRMQTFNGHYEARVMLWIEVVCPHQTAAQQLGLTNPALLAWEVIPFSFVFDWFISVGDWLKALTAMNGLRCVKGMKSNVSSMGYQRVIPETHVFSGGYHYVDAPTTENFVRRDYGRSAYTLTTPPNFPEFKRPLDSFSRLATSLALLKGGSRSRDGSKSSLRL